MNPIVRFMINIFFKGKGDLQIPIMTYWLLKPGRPVTLPLQEERWTSSTGSSLAEHLPR